MNLISVRSRRGDVVIPRVSMFRVRGHRFLRAAATSIPAGSSSPARLFGAAGAWRRGRPARSWASRWRVPSRALDPVPARIRAALPEGWGVYPRSETERNLDESFRTTRLYLLLLIMGLTVAVAAVNILRATGDPGYRAILRDRDPEERLSASPRGHRQGLHRGEAWSWDPRDRSRAPSWAPWRPCTRTSSSPAWSARPGGRSGPQSIWLAVPFPGAAARAAPPLSVKILNPGALPGIHTRDPGFLGPRRGIPHRRARPVVPGLLAAGPREPRPSRPWRYSGQTLGGGPA
ncbi:MAG: hypothetical protein MZU97_12175 [Bacillus subtilis]|nr:hypothetical protein [Bacillus subtilis]